MMKKIADGVVVVGILAACLGSCLPLTSFAENAASPVQTDTALKVRVGKLHDTLARHAQSGDTEAMVYLATLKEQGDEVGEPDLAGAYDLYEQAAIHGNPDAIKKMCLSYLSGEGRPKDVVKASGFCNKIDEKDPVILFWGAYDYQYGLSGPKDIGAAETLYKQAYEDGSGEAADAIGQMAYQGGHLEAARSWYRKGAALGAIDAMDHLATMTEQGEGGVLDLIEANWLYDLAAQRGNAHAAAWIAAHSHLEVPISQLADGKKEISLIHTYGPDQKAETLSSSRIATLLHTYLGGMYPPGNNLPYFYAYFECYVGPSRYVDLCLPTREFPTGYKVNRIMHAIWDGRITVPEYDVAGNRMAQSRFKAGIRIVFPD